MPIYEYECRECGVSFERFVRSTGADSRLECPECRSEDVRKKMSVCGFLGFVATAPGAGLSDAGSCVPSAGG